MNILIVTIGHNYALQFVTCDKGMWIISSLTIEINLSDLQEAITNKRKKKQQSEQITMKTN